MVKFVAKGDVNLSNLEGFDVLKDPLGTKVKEADETSFLMSSDNIEVHVQGKDFAYTNYIFFKIPQEGTVHKLSFSVDGKDAYVISGLNMTLSELASNFDAMSANQVFADMMSGNDHINGSNFSDTLRGYDGNDVINGKNGKDKLLGDAGDDTLNGGLSKDKLTGGAGDDKFVYSDSVKAQNLKRVTDFGVGNDKIQLDHHNFHEIGSAGALNASFFAAGTDATTPTQHVIYDSASGQLFYDANGSDSGEKTLIFKLVAGTALDAADIFVI